MWPLSKDDMACIDKLIWTIAILCLICLTSCSDDDGADVPSLVKDFMLVSTDSEGLAKRTALDNGIVYDVSAQKLKVAGKKTVVRVMGTYTLNGGVMTVYGMEHVYCHAAYPADSIRVIKNGQVLTGAEHLPHDPVKLISVWKSGSFVNIYAGVMTNGDFSSQCVFSEDSVGHYSLVHKRNSKDDEAYTKKVYLSMPVPRNVDRVTFSLNTYDGWVTKVFKWK